MRVLIAILLMSCTSLFPSGVLVEEFLFADPPFDSCHASTLTETSRGLIVAYFAGSQEGNNDIAIYLSKQKENQWDEPEKVVGDLGAPTWNPVLFSMPSGEVLLFYKAGYDPTRWSGFLTRSHDSGCNWSVPEILPPGILGPIKNKPILLEDGTLLCGSSIQSYLIWGCSFERTQDGGRTWERSPPVCYQKLPEYPFYASGDTRNTDHPLGVIQPTLWTEDGRHITMLCRSRRVGYICKATSTDGGKTWTEAYPISLPNPNSGIDAVRMKDGRIALVYNDSKSERTPLNLALSSDGGESWEMVLVLEDDKGSFSYPAIIQTADGLLHMTYTWNRTNIKHVVVDPNKL